MLNINKTKWLSLAWCFSMLGVVGVHILAGDILLFSSSFVSCVTYVFFLVFLVFLPLSLAVLFFLFAPDRVQARAYDVGIIVVSATILALALRALLLSVRGVSLLGFHVVETAIAFALACLLCAVPSVRREIKKNLPSIATLLCIGGITILFGGMLLSRFSALVRKHDDVESKHVLLLVLDGLPIHCINSYNPVAPQSPLDTLLSDALVFENMRTIFPQTPWWFGSLYSGQANLSLKPRRNLFSVLQKGNVATRWIVSHRNAIPEGCHQPFRNYKGLRSSFLREQNVWIPRFLGLDYNIPISSGYFNTSLPETCLGRFVNRHLNPVHEYRNILTDMLTDELRQIRTTSKRSLVVCHVDWRLGFSMRGAQKLTYDGTCAESVMKDSIRENDYRYSLDDSQAVMFAENERRDQLAGMQKTGRLLVEFMETIRGDASLKDTIIILTADHGSICDRGKCWYGFHADEEVLRVPFAIFDSQRRGRDSRLCYTPDISATLLDIFLMSQQISAMGLSVMDERTHKHVFSLTRPSKIRNEWFLSVCDDKGEKLVFNIAPLGDGAWSRSRLKGFVEEVMPVDAVVPKEVRSLLAEAIDVLGLDQAILDRYQQSGATSGE